jgi:hypothetical protein
MSSRPDLKLDWCSHEAAEFAVMRWHYSKRMPKSKLAKIGVWECGLFVGAIIYGCGATSDLVKRYGLNATEGVELVRIALGKHNSSVSRCIAVSLRMIRREYPKLRLVVSFADPEQGHSGGVYKASNWIYDGKTSTSDEYIYKGKRWHGRAFRASHPGMEKHPEVQVVRGSSKHRYLMPLDDEMRAIIAPLARPYPKRAGSADSGTTDFQSGRGGATPTPALSQNHGADDAAV